MSTIPGAETLRRWLARAFLVALPVGLAACGGGGEQLASGGIVGTGDTSLVAVGTISALGAGSITVNGIAFATAGAMISINGQAGTEAALKVGMVVTTQGRALADGSAAAVSIEYHAEVQGVVTGMDTASSAFVVLGQHVTTDQATVFDGGTFATLINQYVEVSGFRASPGELVATRVDIRSAVVQGAPLTVRGAVSALDPAARTFRVGAQLVDYSQVLAAFVPPTLANGTVVGVSGTMVASGDRLIVNTITIVAATIPAAEAARVELEGIITGFAGIASFRVNGQPVDGHAAALAGDVTRALADGVKVEVKGRMTQGVVVATTIEIEQSAVVTVDGIADMVNVTASTVVVAGQQLVVTGTTQFEDRSAAAIRNFGLAAVSVGDHLLAHAGVSQSGLLATRIERLDPGVTSTTAEGVISEFVSAADFKIAGHRVNASSARFVGGTAAGLANGRRVSAEGTLSGDVLMASTVEFKDSGTPPADASVAGVITDFVAPSNFKVAGQQVDASGATIVGGTVANLANGRRVTASGVLRAGILVARTVSIEATATPTLQVQGKITSFVAISNFVVAGRKVDATRAALKNGTLAELANGRDVTATGPVVAGVLQATAIDFNDSVEQAGASAEGKITAFVSPSNFVVAGRTIDASAAKFVGGTIADLANGRKVEVDGKLVGAVLKASKVEFD